MKRAFVAAALAMLVGCDGDSSDRSVILYWTFLRHTLTQGNIGYDLAVDQTATTGGDAACAESGVTTVTITDESGRVVNPEFPDVPCVFAGVQGVQINFVGRGTRTWTLTGFIGNAPAYQSAVTFDVRGDTVVDVVIEGIPDDLDLVPQFLDALGRSVVSTTCATAGVQTVAYSLVDGAGTLVATSPSVPCLDPPVLSFRTASGTGIDRDNYAIRIQAFGPAAEYDTATARLVPQCVDPEFDHFSAQTGPAAVVVSLFDVSQNDVPGVGLCQ